MTQDGRSGTNRFDGAAVADDFGNVHIAYMRRPEGGLNDDILYARSVDGGATFTDFRKIVNGVDADKPWIAVGPDAANPGKQAVWITFSNTIGGQQRIFATGASISGLGSVAPFPSLLCWSATEIARTTTPFPRSARMANWFHRWHFPR